MQRAGECGTLIFVKDRRQRNHPKDKHPDPGKPDHEQRPGRGRPPWAAREEPKPERRHDKREPGSPWRNQGNWPTIINVIIAILVILIIWALFGR